MDNNFQQRNLAFFDFINHTLEIRRHRTWDDLAKSITELKMKLIYRKFADLFPRKFDYSAELAALPNEFKTIHYSTLKGTTIIDEVVRFSLYSDSIIVFHPLQNPAITNPRMNPGRNPKLWLPDFLNAIHFYIVIQKWVRAGIVQIIVNPYDYDELWYKRIMEEATKRVETMKKDKDLYDEFETEFAEQFAIQFKTEDSLEDIKKALIELKNPRYTEDEASKFAIKIKESIPKLNPLYKSLPKHLFGSHIMTTKGGGPLESILSIAEITGGNIYTPSKLYWRTMQEIQKNEFWHKLNHVYSKVDLPFLNNVSTDFALNLRQDGRLSGVRTELKKVFSELNQLELNNIDEKKVSYLYEGFKDEIRKTESEWKAIKKESEITRQHLTVSAAAIPIMIEHPASILPIALISGNSLISSLRTSKVKQDAFKVKNPVSVFVEAQHKTEGFFTQLKNCVM